jgi:hypothetical protein
MTFPDSYGSAQAQTLISWCQAQRSDFPPWQALKKNKSQHFPPTWSHFMQSWLASRQMVMNYEFPSWKCCSMGSDSLPLTFGEVWFTLAWISDGWGPRMALLGSVNWEFLIREGGKRVMTWKTVGRALCSNHTRKNNNTASSSPWVLRRQ